MSFWLSILSVVIHAHGSVSSISVGRILPRQTGVNTLDKNSYCRWS
jgi:hypothetical protein